MKIESVKFDSVRLNDDNPRTISDYKFRKLVDSILSLPKMLDIRPVVVDADMTALGGNMRVRALSVINEMPEDEIKERLETLRNYQDKTDEEKEALLSFWSAWKNKPTVPVIKASLLTKDEEKEFIVKDNVAFGEWDMDALANVWDSELLNEWGIDCPDWNYKSDNADSAPLTEGDEKTETAKEIHSIHVKNLYIQMSQEEYDRLYDSVKRYSDDKGMSFGYIAHLLELEDNYEQNTQD